VEICSSQWDTAVGVGEDYSNPQRPDIHKCIDNNHITLSGTSMAAPIVAGAVALLKQKNPDWTPEEIKSVLKNTADDIEGDINTKGSGRINISRAIKERPLIAEIKTTKRIYGTDAKIFGTASGYGFQNYVVSYKKEGEAEWTELCSSNEQKDDEVLCYFDSTNLEEGNYLFKLEVSSTIKTSIDYESLDVKNFEIKRIGDDLNYIKGIERVEGDIYLDDFEEYFIEYQNETGDWNVLCSGIEPSAEGVLCNIDVSNFKNGAYYFRISVILNGRYKSGSPFRAVVFKELLDGWPVEFNGSSNRRLNLIEDDSGKMVIARGYSMCEDSPNERISEPTDFNYSYNPDLYCTGNVIYIYNSEGSLVANIDSISGKKIHSAIQNAIYSENGLDYLVLTGGYSEDGRYRGLLYPNGSVYKEINSLCGDYSPFTISGNQFFNAYWDWSVGKGYILGFDKDGNPLPNFPITLNSEPGEKLTLINHLVFDNQEGDKHITVLASSTFGSKVYLDIYSLEGGSLIKRNILDFGPSAEVLDKYMVAGDVNNDGKKEIIVGVGIRDLQSSTKFYEFDESGNIIAQSEEINNSLPLQIVLAKDDYSNLFIIAGLNGMSSTKDKIVVFDNLLNFQRELTFDNPEELIGGITIGDVDSDNNPEIVASYDFEWGIPFSGIYIFNLDGTIEKKIEIPGGYLDDNYYSNEPILEDINNDGKIDILQQTSSFGPTRIYAYTLSQDYDESKIEWPMFMHDPQNTMCYDCEQKSTELPVMKPQSKIANYEDYNLFGNLTMILQKEEGGEWINLDYFKQQVSIPANGLLKLDTGKDSLGNQVFVGWNNLDVFVNSTGSHRVYVLFESDGHSLESNWEFEVI